MKGYAGAKKLSHTFMGKLCRKTELIAFFREYEA
jgi:hypothetical protein